MFEFGIKIVPLFLQ